MRYYLDTNIIIYGAKDVYPHLSDRILKHSPKSILIPSIVLYEIEYGAEKSINYDKTMFKYEKFLRLFSIAPFSVKAARYAGKVRSDLEKKGTPIGAYDVLIAGTVLADDGVLVTHNVEEFKRVEGLRVEDWTST